MKENQPAVLPGSHVDLATAWVDHLMRRGEESGVWLALGQARRSFRPAQWDSLLQQRFGLQFCTLVHPRAYISPQAWLGPGVFVGANSVVGPGTRLEAHVFVNRGVTIGHDNNVGKFSRIQPGANVGGLSRIGTGVTIGLGATLIERLRVGDGSVIGSGAVVLEDVPARVMVAGVPATIRKHLADDAGAGT